MGNFLEKENRRSSKNLLKLTKAMESVTASNKELYSAYHSTSQRTSSDKKVMDNLDTDWDEHENDRVKLVNNGRKMCRAIDEYHGLYAIAANNRWVVQRSMNNIEGIILKYLSKKKGMSWKV